MEDDSRTHGTAGAGLVVPYIAAYCCTWAAVLTAIVLSLPLRVEAMTEDDAATELALVLGAGAVVALVLAPVAGALSDRTTSRLGMRRPWLVGGLVVGAAGSIVGSTAGDVPTLAAGWCVMNGGFTVVLAALAAVLPDQVAARRRGGVAGLVAACPPVGVVLGTALVHLAGDGSGWALSAPVVLTAVAVLAFCAVLPDRRRAAAPRAPLLRGALTSLRGNRDFGWAWVSRFALFTALALVFSFQALYLLESLGRDVSELSRLMLSATLAQSSMLIVGGVVAGRLSDRLGRRKPFVTAGAALVAAGPVVMVVSGTFQGFLAGTGLIGLGMGLYLGVGLALITEVLTSPRTDAGKDLGIITFAAALPQVLVAVFVPAWLSLGIGGLAGILLAATVLAVAGALAILPVRRVR